MKKMKKEAYLKNNNQNINSFKMSSSIKSKENENTEISIETREEIH